MYKINAALHNALHKSYINTENFMRLLVDQYIADIKIRHAAIQTVLPLEDLIRGRKKNSEKCIHRPQNAFILYRKEIQARQRGQQKRGSP